MTLKRDIQATKAFIVDSFINAMSVCTMTL